jgi:hypothetical protein
MSAFLRARHGGLGISVVSLQAETIAATGSPNRSRISASIGLIFDSVMEQCGGRLVLGAAVFDDE